MTQAADTLLSTPLRAASHRELQAAGRRTYVLRQRFSYTYDAPVRDLDHRLVVVPPRRHGDQRRLMHSVTVSAADARTTHQRTRGQHCHQVSRAAGAGQGRVRGQRGRRAGRDLLLYLLLSAAALTDPRLLCPTRLTAADAAIRRLAATMADQDRLATADRFCTYVHEAISYANGVTSIATTAAEALAGGRGVCRTPRMS